MCGTFLSFLESGRAIGGLRPLSSPDTFSPLERLEPSRSFLLSSPADPSRSFFFARFDSACSFSKTRRGNWEHWTTDDDKKEGASFRNHSIRGFFQSVKPSMMPGLNESMSK